MALEPPPVRSINAAIDNLVEIGALRPPPSLGLTTLGYHLANLPLDARLGKMLIYGAVLQCVEPVLTVTAALSYKSPFLKPFGTKQRGEAQAARDRFAGMGRTHSNAHVSMPMTAR